MHSPNVKRLAGRSARCFRLRRRSAGDQTIADRVLRQQVRTPSRIESPAAGPSPSASPPPGRPKGLNSTISRGKLKISPDVTPRNDRGLLQRSRSEATEAPRLVDLPIVGTVRSAKNRDDDCDKDARRDPVGAIATHKSSSVAQNHEPRVSGARPALCPDTAKGRHPNLFAKTLSDDPPSNRIFPAPDTVHIRSAPGSQRKNYRKRPPLTCTAARVQRRRA